MLLETTALEVRYGRALAVRGVSMGVAEGEVVAIIGANGAGKTTILRAICGLVRPSSGEIAYGSERIDGKLPHQIIRKGIAMVPAGRMVFGDMTVLDNLRMGAYASANRAKVAHDVEEVYLHFPALQEKRRLLARDLSGGQQQMVAIARALMARPRLLLMDEPSIGLSPLMVAEVVKIIKEINERGISVLLVEQNARLALRLSQRAYVLEAGKVSLSGDAHVLASDERVREAYLGGATGR